MIARPLGYLNTMYEALITLLGTAIVGVFIWGMRINSKSDVQAQRHEDLITLLNTKFDGMGYRFDGVNSKFDSIADKFDGVDNRLERVERKVLNGDYRAHD